MIEIMVLMVMFGLLLSGLSGHMPTMPLQVIMFVVGIMIALTGILILYGRATKTGAIHLLAMAQPNSILWFFISRDGTVKITPAFRRIEGMSENKEQDTIIQDMKAYRLFDHQVRFVVDHLGFSADARHCIYAKIMRSKYGFEGIKDGRRKILFWMHNNEQPEFVEEEQKGGGEYRQIE